MYRSAFVELDERIRAAMAAVAEQRRLLRLRDALAEELRAAQREVDGLAVVRREEDRDVVRYERGLWGFLYGLFADREARVDKERREAAEAAVRHQEGVGTRDRLAEQLAAIEARLPALIGAEERLDEELRAKERALLASGGAAAEALGGLSAELAELDATLQATEEALTVGRAASEALGRLVEALSSARAWGTADMMTESILVSMQKRSRLDDARRLAGEAQARITVFRRELGDVGRTLDAVVRLAEHHRFLDTFFDNIFSDLSVQSRIVDALRTSGEVRGEVDRQLRELTAHRDELFGRRSEAERRRLAWLSAPQ